MNIVWGVVSDGDKEADTLYQPSAWACAHFGRSRGSSYAKAHR